MTESSTTTVDKTDIMFLHANLMRTNALGTLNYLLRCNQSITSAGDVAFPTAFDNALKKYILRSSVFADSCFEWGTHCLSALSAISRISSAFSPSRQANSLLHTVAVDLYPSLPTQAKEWCIEGNNIYQDGNKFNAAVREMLHQLHTNAKMNNPLTYAIIIPSTTDKHPVITMLDIRRSFNRSMTMQLYNEGKGQTPATPTTSLAYRSLMAEALNMKNPKSDFLSLIDEGNPCQVTMASDCFHNELNPEMASNELLRKKSLLVPTTLVDYKFSVLTNQDFYRQLFNSPAKYAILSVTNTHDSSGIILTFSALLVFLLQEIASGSLKQGFCYMDEDWVSNLDSLPTIAGADEFPVVQASSITLEQAMKNLDFTRNLKAQLMRMINKEGSTEAVETPHVEEIKDEWFVCNF